MKTVVAFTLAFIAILFCKTGFAQYDDTLVRVYRYYDTTDKVYITVAEDEYNDSEIKNWGWTDRQLLFYGYHKPGPDRVGVYGWLNPVSKARISIAEDEFTDEHMQKNGYNQKHFQFYALTRRGPHTVCVYMWLMSKRHVWVTIAEDTDTDAYLRKGYHHKTYQYYAIYSGIRK